jgi:hypothetical protein
MAARYRDPRRRFQPTLGIAVQATNQTAEIKINHLTYPLNPERT